MSKNTNLSFLTDYITADITNGRIGINTPSPTVAFDVVGVAKFSSSVGVGGTATGTYGTLSVFGGISTKNDNNGKLEIGRYSSGAPNSYIKLGANSDSLRITNNTDIADIFTLTNAGNVGIGTSSPSARLTIKGPSSATAAQQLSFEYHSNTTKYFAIGLQDATGNAQLMAGTGNSLIFYTNSDLATTNERMRITSAGDVLISTSSSATNPPGFARVLNVRNTDAALVLSNTTGTAKDWSIGALTSGSLAIFDGSSERMRITSAGNVGIGTSSPSNKLDINQTGSAINSVSGVGLKIYADAGNDVSLALSQTARGTFFLENLSAAAVPSDIRFRADVASNFIFMSNSTERMRITSGGNVGIGTSSPNGKLSVQDAVYGEYLRVLSGVVAGNQTSVYLAWNNGGNITLQQIVVGAADSGGSGFRVLRIPNT
jgi:hypothetical protein